MCVTGFEHGADVVRDRPQSFVQGIAPGMAALQPGDTDHVYTVFFQKLDHYSAMH